MPTTISGSNGVTTPTGAVYNGIQSATAQASTSGTSIDFTGSPSWVKRITVMFNGISTNGTGTYQIQIGSGSYSISGYISFGMNGSGGALVGASNTTGMAITNAVLAASTYSGNATLTNISGNSWTYVSQIGSGSTVWGFGAGSSPALSGALDRLRIIASTTGNPADTFDAGTINILYE